MPYELSNLCGLLLDIIIIQNKYDFRRKVYLLSKFVTNEMLCALSVVWYNNNDT